MTAKQKLQAERQELLAMIRELAGRVRVQNLKDELLVARAKTAVRNGEAPPEPHHLLVIGKTGGGKSRLGGAQ